ncbi:MAG: asparagine synthase-related protein [Ectothiorhodospira sp.]
MHGAPLDILSARERPWFTARYRGGEVSTEGTPSCQLGHQLDNRTGPTPDGIFVEWHWDGTTLTVRNDRYGIHPLFYACHGGEIRISPSILHVLDGPFPKTLNEPGLAVFFRLGFFIREDTPFEHVHVLPPGSELRWQKGDLQLRRGPRDAPMPAHPVGSFDEAVEEYAALFRQAMKRRAPDGSGFTVPISGGRDSRHILFELLQQGHKPDRTVTVRSRPPSPNEDIRIARILADTLELRHVEIDRPASYFQANLKDIELTHFCGSGHTWLLPVAAYLKGKTHTLYDGLAGSVISGGFQVNERKLALVEAGHTRDLATHLLRENAIEPFLNSTLRPPMARRMNEDLAIERLTEELEGHMEARHPLVSYIFWNRTRRGISLIPYSIMGDVERVFCPYLDHDVFNFLMNLDASYSLGNALHDETIRRSYPEYAHLPYENKDAPRDKGQDYSAYYRRSVREFLGHFLRHPETLRSGLIRSERVLLMVMRDLLKPRCENTWYLQPSLFSLELERAATQGRSPE